MLSPLEAYYLFIDKFPKAETDVLFDWDDFYGCSQYKSGDYVDDYWKIDKQTGKISEMDFLEFAEELSKFDERHGNTGDINDYKAPQYKIKDLVRKKVS